MSNVAETALAALAVLLIATALFTMAAGDLAVAGASFLSASLVIFLRQTRLEDDGTAQ
jgi:hypothetical protein